MGAAKKRLWWRWQWLLERGFILPALALAIAIAALLVLALGGTSMGLVRIGLLTGSLALVFYGIHAVIRRVGRTMKHAERINQAGLALSNEERPGILRAGLRTAIEFADARSVEASVITRNVHGDLVVEGTSVQRTLPYLPTIDLTPVLGPGWEDTPPGTSIERPRAELARALAMRHTNGTVLLAPMHAKGMLTGLLAVGFDGHLDRDRTGAIHTLAAMLGSALTREQLHNKLVQARAQAHFQSLVQNASDLILVVNGELSIVYQSPSVERILGYPRDDLQYRNLDALAAPDHVEALTAALEHATTDAGEVPVLMSSEWIDASGTRRRVELNITNRLDVPEVRGLVLNVTDVTHQVETNEALQRTEAALRQIHKLDAVGRLAGGIAHDFNNILGAIMMTAGSLREEFGSQDSNDETIDEIENAAVRGARLTRQLLTFSRSDAPSPEIADVNEIIGGFHRMLRRLIDERVALHNQQATRLPAVRIDRGMLEQALMNLVVNARDALPNGHGSITIRTQQRHLNEPKPSATGGDIPAGHYVVLSVEDDGVGMAPEILPRIFEPFFTTKSVDKGTGLGLSMVYGIVRQSDGYLEVSSEPDQGTTISIYLPARREVSGPLRAAPAAAAPHGKGRILVIEDDDALRKAAVRVLQKHGYEVLYAPDGIEGERLFDEWDHDFDLVITDVVMPRRSGPEMVGRLRLKREDVRVLYISGYTDGLVSLGNSEALLRKPFRPVDLATRVHSILELGPDVGTTQPIKISR